MRKLTSFLAIILSFIISLSGMSSALAQPVPQPPSRGIITFYLTPEQQTLGAQVYQQLEYNLAIPSADLSATLPNNVRDFPAFYKQVLEESRKKNGINGSFTESWLDFQASFPVVPGTSTLFVLKDPKGGRLYSVIAGLPSSQCPLKISETRIAFFDKPEDAAVRADELDSRGFSVYVSPSDNLTIRAFSQLLYDRETDNKKTNKDCFLVSGATERVRVDFQKVFYLLPPALQQPAREVPFDYVARVGSSIYLVNARKNLTKQ